jgi:lysophospholipase L1-like esterase
MKTMSPRVLAIGVASLDGADEINVQLRDIAASEKVQFVEMSVPVNGMMTDRIHLTAAGYRVWTSALIAAIRGRPGESPKTQIFAN